jgi:plasmid stabilization system protein ParE
MHIEWSRRASEDLRSLRLFGNRRSSDSGSRMARKITASVAKLFALSEASEEKGVGRTGRVTGTRELVIADTPFIVPYRARYGHVEILRVYHHSLPWPDQF